jgi:hypothetical protein
MRQENLIQKNWPALMKRFIALFAAIGLIAVMAGCGRKSKEIVTQPAGVVSFPRAGISLTLSEGWQRIDLDPGIPVCPPTLIGTNGMLQAMIFDANRPDPKTASSKLRASFEANSDSVKDSFSEEDFVTESGLKGVHLSYTAVSEKNGAVTKMRSHNYIVHNREGRCVAISYLTTVRTESDAVHQMIRKTLKVQ